MSNFSIIHSQQNPTDVCNSEVGNFVSFVLILTVTAHLVVDDLSRLIASLGEHNRVMKVCRTAMVKDIVHKSSTIFALYSIFEHPIILFLLTLGPVSIFLCKLKMAANMMVCMC